MSHLAKTVTGLQQILLLGAILEHSQACGDCWACTEGLATHPDRGSNRELYVGKVMLMMLVMLGLLLA